jgi:hypothetical protein
MEKQQKAHVLPGEVGISMATMQEERRGLANFDKQQFNDLTRLRIERNKAARHARCSMRARKMSWGHL